MPYYVTPHLARGSLCLLQSQLILAVCTTLIPSQYSAQHSSSAQRPSRLRDPRYLRRFGSNVILYWPTHFLAVSNILVDLVSRRALQPQYLVPLIQAWHLCNLHNPRYCGNLHTLSTISCMSATRGESRWISHFSGATTNNTHLRCCARESVVLAGACPVACKRCDINGLTGVGWRFVHTAQKPAINW